MLTEFSSPGVNLYQIMILGSAFQTRMKEEEVAKEGGVEVCIGRQTSATGLGCCDVNAIKILPVEMRKKGLREGPGLLSSLLTKRRPPMLRKCLSPQSWCILCKPLKRLLQVTSLPDVVLGLGLLLYYCSTKAKT